jgi:PLP dependent protein
VADALARHAERRGRRVRVLLEVNLGNEPTKGGVAPAAATALLAALAQREWLEIDGLMAIPPPGASAEASRPYFRALRALRDRLRPQAPANAPLRELSMGMSEDFTVAIEEGATMVRVGRAIFGARPAP